ncbi:flagellar hook assembly protein FlgD [Rhizobium sp.]|jgi:flagellar basal-body rod modification protein FlgD|uniref:flagellar hook assembly protein FlgD n=1 Tax=Rhizobium sp. TaxID=391 RepID=UPI002897F18E
MVTISPTSTNTQTTTTAKTTASSSDAAAASLDYNSFLKLLITQMQNQDPTDPMDATEQVSQLATFSQVEQSIKMNSNLESLISQSNLSNASNYIGKTITSADGKTSGVVASVEVTSEGLTAKTVDGAEISIGEGITISTAKTTTTTETSA